MKSNIFYDNPGPVICMYRWLKLIIIQNSKHFQEAMLSAELIARLSNSKVIPKSKKIQVTRLDSSESA